MKITFLSSGFNSYIGILIGIIILVISGIGSAKKRKAQQMRAPQGNPGIDETEGDETEPFATGPLRNAQNPLERLELLLSGQQPFGQQRFGQQRFDRYDESQFVEDEADIPLEVMEETKKEMELPQEGMSVFDTPDYNDLASPISGSTGEMKDSDKNLTVDELFTDMCEIKKAVIYSEIFTRKYT